jgi:hypothetical protein
VFPNQRTPFPLEKNKKHFVWDRESQSSKITLSEWIITLVVTSMLHVHIDSPSNLPLDPIFHPAFRIKTLVTFQIGFRKLLKWSPRERRLWVKQNESNDVCSIGTTHLESFFKESVVHRPSTSMKQLSPPPIRVWTVWSMKQHTETVDQSIVFWKLSFYKLEHIHSSFAHLEERYFRCSTGHFFFTLFPGCSEDDESVKTHIHSTFVPSSFSNELLDVGWSAI